jgi:hypothetical protein
VALFATSAKLTEQKGNGLKFPASIDTGGHNNTKINPVFRGMVWSP